MTAHHLFPVSRLSLALLLGLAACAQFPEVDKAEARGSGTIPAVSKLQPLDGLLDEGNFAAARAQASAASLDARAAVLRQKAAALRKIKPAE